MRQSFIAALIAAAALLALWSLSSSAQVIDANPCQQACYEANAACVTECGTHGNPIECEADCEDAMRDCLHRCG